LFTVARDFHEGIRAIGSPGPCTTPVSRPRQQQRPTMVSCCTPHLLYNRSFIPQNVDFLSDTSANRYAYESDDEDQSNPLTHHAVQRIAHITIQGDPYPGKSAETIIVASGEAGKAWAQGAQLGEQRAVILVDDSTVTCLYLVTSQPS
jgi:hypothetical protein